jgi:uncharacterized protein (TIGR03435 family)
MGISPQAYAEGILRVCEFYVTSPVLCAAGVTGADLKRRIQAIMADAFTLKLSLGKKALLALAATLAVAGPVAVGLVAPPGSRAQPAASGRRFEVASIRPGGTMTQFKCLPGNDKTTPVRLSRCETLRVLIMQAYDLRDFQISGPAWIDSDLFGVEATTGTPASKAEMMQMLGTLLGDRFQLRFHRATKTLPVYALAVDKGRPKLGPNFHASKKGDPSPSGGDFRWRTSMQGFAHIITMYLRYPLPNPDGSVDDHPGRPVIDRTGLSGEYDIVMTSEPGHNWFAMLNSQLGLRLESRKAPFETIIIDHALQTPTEN